MKQAVVTINKGRNKSWLLLVIPAAFLFVFFIIPIFHIAWLSFTDGEGNLSLLSYLKFFQSSVYFKVIAVTFRVSFVVTIACLILGYPVAYTMAHCSKRMSTIIMIAVMIPFWTSLLVRTYAWMILLQTNGVINNLLIALGIISEPLKLYKNSLGVYIGMVHILLPYMILALYPVMKGIDTNFVPAAKSLGANSVVSFLKVYFPLSLQGIASGSILVFVMGIGYFITPSLLGGTGDTMISQMIQVQVSKLLNWPFASVISVLLLIISMVFLYLSKKVMKVDKVW